MCAGPANGLFAFDSFTFTPAGVTGRQGPTLAQLTANSAYQAQSWTQNVAFLNETVQGVQLFTIPKSGTYTFIVAGAQGGGGLGCPGGLGAQISVQASLMIGDKISIVVGQAGVSTMVSSLNGFSDVLTSGGGGGSFVFLTSGSLLVAAGGGGAASCSLSPTGVGNYRGQNASLTTSGTGGTSKFQEDNVETESAN